MLQHGHDGIDAHSARDEDHSLDRLPFLLAQIRGWVDEATAHADQEGSAQDVVWCSPEERCGGVVV